MLVLNRSPTLLALSALVLVARPSRPPSTTALALAAAAQQCVLPTVPAPFRTMSSTSEPAPASHEFLQEKLSALLASPHIHFNPRPPTSASASAPAPVRGTEVAREELKQALLALQKRWVKDRASFVPLGERDPRTKVVWTENEADQPSEFTASARVKEEGGVPRISFLTLDGDQSLFACKDDGLKARDTGRGEYYKQLYGGRRRGHGRPPPHDDRERGVKRPRAGQVPLARLASPEGRRALTAAFGRRLGFAWRTLLGRPPLRRARARGKSYPAYRDLHGAWAYPTFRLLVDHVQGDAYAPPSKMRLCVPHAAARIPPELFSNPVRAVALRDYLTRQVCAALDRQQHTAGRSTGWAGEKGGQVSVDRPDQQVLERSAVVIVRPDDADEGGFELRFCVSLPAQGRTILAEQAERVFSAVIPALARGLLYASLDASELADFVDAVEDQDALRSKVESSGLVAFVPNGAVLPRASGAADTPLRAPAVVPFQSPPNIDRTFVLPHRGAISGMAVPRGVTMVAGGGFHGKSTLLDALARGCYNHIPGDGREFLVTSSRCVSVQGEDGRAVTNVDISPFIGTLPGGAQTASFSTQDASGSTSMAAGVIEAVECGADVLLFDEDTCATNFLIRDRRMQRLVAADPITPLVYKIRALLADHGSSSILVIGGCGDYFDVADLVLEMRDYRCFDITSAAKQIAQEIPSAVPEHEGDFGAVKPRELQPRTLPSGDRKTAVRRRTTVELGQDEALELSALVQLVQESQTRAIAAALKYLHHNLPAGVPLAAAVHELQTVLDGRGMDALVPPDRIDGFLARPRALEVAMAINRLVWVALGQMLSVEFEC
ncbi:hypothetical protein BD413DRAFT_611016 [Trametes elegans]|nr:hypothetical protein BD413DRAFT_611016 [Trametes elegans]